MLKNALAIGKLDLQDKVILLRVDFNVSFNSDGKIMSDFRLRAGVSTIKELLQAGAKKIIIISHLGRPKKFDSKLSLTKILPRLNQLLTEPIEFVQDWRNFQFDNQNQQLFLLENIRFEAGELENSTKLAKDLLAKTKADIFIQDAFSVLHRRAMSTVAITQLVPSFMSQRLSKEYAQVQSFVTKSKSPKVAIIGGAKISDKIHFLQHLASQVDYLIIGGVMANTFLAAQGIKLGKSLIEKDQTSTINDIYKIWQENHDSLDGIILPQDVAVADDLESSLVQISKINNLSHHQMIGDIGPQTIIQIGDIIQRAGSVIWNGSLGYEQNPFFATSTIEITKLLIKNKVPTLIGGGDTAGFVDNFTTGQYPSSLFLSTGGGACLELIANGDLIGIRGLLKT